MDDKERFQEFLKAATLILWGSVAIGTTATALNSFPGTFPSIIAGLNLVTTGIAMFKIIKARKK